jgi:hypothetical protein
MSKKKIDDAFDLEEYEGSPQEQQDLEDDFLKEQEDFDIEVYENKLNQCSKKNTCACSRMLSEPFDHCHDPVTGEPCPIHEKHCLNCHFPFCNCNLRDVVFLDPNFNFKLDLEAPLIPTNPKEIKDILIVLQDDIFALYRPKKYQALSRGVPSYELYGIDYNEHHVTHAATSLYCLRKADPQVIGLIKTYNLKLVEIIDLLIKYQETWPVDKEEIEDKIVKKICSKMRIPPEY